MPEARPEFIDVEFTPGMAYTYRVTSVSASGAESAHSAGIWVRAVAGVPRAAVLQRVYPNPIRDQALFAFGIPEYGPGSPDGVRVTIDLYDIAGRKVARVVEGTYLPGDHEVPWSPSADGRPLAPGIYVTLLRANGQEAVGRVAIAR